MIKTRKELIESYLNFFKERGHEVIPNAPLIPEHDPTVLFTTAGMHPLVPFILGEEHPAGKRLVNVQKCIRTTDIEEVGDDTHLTFFEMLGNWSLGDYWKEDAIKFSYEFLTSKKWLGLNKDRIHVSVFSGDELIAKDEESAKIWMKLGIPKERIWFFGKEHNFWGPAGLTGPCGPSTEIFYDTGKEKCSEKCNPSCNCGKYFEIWNDVFMEYNKTSEGKYEKLKRKTVDTGVGVERTVAMLQSKSNVYDIEVFSPIIEKIKNLANIPKPTSEQEKSIRIISDHLKAATFILAEHVSPSNIDRGYVLRRLIRKAIRHGRLLGLQDFSKIIVEEVIKIYEKDYKHLIEHKPFILSEIEKEEKRFLKTLEKGLKKFEEIVSNIKETVSGKDAFDLYQSYGFPIEMTQELAKERGFEVDVEGFKLEFKKHQQISRQATEKRFKGGLADITKEATKLHTATHLLHQALRDVLGKHVRQHGSHITSERLRFDFNFNRKLTQEEIRKVEEIVNRKIKEDLPVWKEEMTLDEAKKRGALAFFGEKYGKKVFVYFIGDYSKEVCGGPHVKNTKELGRFKIIKEEGVGAGIRRIKAILEPTSETENLKKEKREKIKN